ncbi:MAG: 4Fe-4S binding protein [Candidatus Bathyarchaeota archaeon]|nr:4Fe-4S binding protein [Candidatus Bathyarchaeota archaeon]
MADWTPTELEKKLSNIKLAVTIPVNLYIEGTQRVLDLSQMEQILSQSKHISISDCACRKKIRKCEAPLDVCFSLDERAEKLAKKGSARKVSLAEALDALRRSHEAGLVHLTITYQGKDKPEVVCSCCSCCCHSLSGLIRFGMPDAVVASKYVAQIDSDKCVNCGKCISRCQFKARRIENGQVSYEVKRCFGCGVCVSTCPTGAISLVERKNRNR